MKNSVWIPIIGAFFIENNPWVIFYGPWLYYQFTSAGLFLLYLNLILWK